MTRVLIVLAFVVAAVRPVAAQAPEEVARVRAHLEAAREVVRARDVSALSPTQRANRASALAVLDRYIERGVFPVRTDDAYPGLRPRFIDARGVHCAVGEMIAGTGHAELARAINRAYEYSFVREIDSPALLAWAHDHGFAVDELARIQPRYSSPPTPDSIRRDVEQYKDTYMLACSDAPPPARVTVTIAGDDDGHVTITAPDGASAFTRCFASAAQQGQRHYGGAMSPSPSAFTRKIELALSPPVDVLDRRLRDQIGFAPQCAPRPGPLARRATLSITNSPEEGFSIQVTTQPANAEVAHCIEAYLEPRTRDFHGVAQLAYSHRWNLQHMTARTVHDAVLRSAAGFATDCYAVATAPKQLTIAVSASPDDKAFALTLGDVNPDYARCVTDKLQPALRKAFTVERDVEGTTKPYFRIDTEIRTTVTIAVESPEARDARLTRAREAMKKRQRELRQELERRRYE